MAPPVAPLSKKALIGSALRELTSVLAAPAGASAPAGKMNGALSNILSIALDNRNFLGAEGVFDFGEELGRSRRRRRRLEEGGGEGKNTQDLEPQKIEKK